MYLYGKGRRWVTVGNGIRREERRGDDWRGVRIPYVSMVARVTGQYSQKGRDRGERDVFSGVGERKGRRLNGA